jgi:hypothetical protein
MLSVSQPTDMTDPKPLLILWPKTAMHAAGPDLVTLQLTTEASEITSQTHDWFLHALPGEAERACFVCSGYELSEAGRIFIQRGIYVSMSPIGDDHPDPDRRRKVSKYREAVKNADDEIFASYEDTSDR